MPYSEQDYYQVLGIPRDADGNTIKQAYHKLAMKWHPDRNKSPEAEERFKNIAKAYAILKDPKKRAQYDALGMEGVAHYTPEDLFGGLDFGDLFGDMGFDFGGGGIFDRMFGHRRTRPAHGKDLRVRIEVPLELIDQGGKQKVRISHPASCSDCNGYGTRSARPPSLCPACQGSGRKVDVRQEQRHAQQVKIQQITICPVCHGRGTEIGEPCRACGGYGQVEKEETIKITIPPGIEDGMLLRVPKRGLPGDAPGVPPGDLHVVVYTKQDGRFQRMGSDLWRSETIDVAGAVLGTTIKVPTLGSRVKVNIPAGTQPDEVLRLKGKGLPRYGGSGRGDLNLRIQIHIPKKISAAERDLYEKLKRVG